MKVKVKKRKRSLGTRIDALAQVPRKFKIWFQKMRSSSVYRTSFWAALWGEMGEYEIRFSSLSGFFWLFLGIIGFLFLPTTRYKGLFKLALVVLFFAFLIIGVRQFGDLQSPIWWADRFAVRARQSYMKNGNFQRYSRYSSYFRSQPRANPPLRFEEVRYLCVLYHQFCESTISAAALDELGTYTASEIDYFYRAFDVRPTDPRFPPQYIGRYVGSNRRS